MSLTSRYCFQYGDRGGCVWLRFRLNLARQACNLLCPRHAHRQLPQRFQRSKKKRKKTPLHVVTRSEKKTAPAHIVTRSKSTVVEQRLLLFGFTLQSVSCLLLSTWRMTTSNPYIPSAHREQTLDPLRATMFLSPGAAVTAEPITLVLPIGMPKQDVHALIPITTNPNYQICSLCMVVAIGKRLQLQKKVPRLSTVLEVIGLFSAIVSHHVDPVILFLILTKHSQISSACVSISRQCLT